MINHRQAGTRIYWGGFNWVAVAVFIMSCIVYVLLFDPIMLVARPMFVYMSATGATLVFSVIAYTILGRIFLINNKKGIGSYRDSDLSHADINERFTK